MARFPFETNTETPLTHLTTPDYLGVAEFVAATYLQRYGASNGRGETLDGVSFPIGEASIVFSVGNEPQTANSNIESWSNLVTWAMDILRTKLPQPGNLKEASEISLLNVQLRHTEIQG